MHKQQTPFLSYTYNYFIRQIVLFFILKINNVGLQMIHVPGYQDIPCLSRCSSAQASKFQA